MLVDAASRQDAIRRYAEQSVKRVHGKVHMSPALLDQVANLVENPVAILGNFDPAYLDLPKEVLITCLEHHQKYFPVEQVSGGKLLPHFVGIRNGMSVHQEIVREGYERVLAARLADARFFYNQDRRTPLASKVDALKGVMFQAEARERFSIRRSASKNCSKRLLHTSMGGFPDLEKAKRAADLCKADLVTDTVREFPELQGIMARLYAQADGEDAEVSGRRWKNIIGRLLSPGSCPRRIPPHSSRSPTNWIRWPAILPSGLSQRALPIPMDCGARPWEFCGFWKIVNGRSIWKSIDASGGAQPASVKKDVGETQKSSIQFMQQRFAALLEERGLSPDEIDAVLGAGIGDVPDALEPLESTA